MQISPFEKRKKIKSLAAQKAITPIPLDIWRWRCLRSKSAASRWDCQTLCREIRREWACLFLFFSSLSFYFQPIFRELGKFHPLFIGSVSSRELFSQAT
jgi:hypothetical protein